MKSIILMHRGELKMAKHKNENNGRFVRVHIEEFDACQYVSIILDKATGVQYLSTSQDNGVGVTVLKDKDGKPLLYQPPSP